MNQFLEKFKVNIIVFLLMSFILFQYVDMATITNKDWRNAKTNCYTNQFMGIAKIEKSFLKSPKYYCFRKPGRK